MNVSPDIMRHPLAVAEQARSKRPAGAVLPVNPLEESAWDSLVAAHPSGSFFHTAAWARVLHDTYGHTPAYFCRRRRDRLDQLLPVMEVRSAWSGLRGVSLPFTDACAPLSPQSPDAAELYEEALQYGRARGWRYLETRGGTALWHGASPSVSFWTHQLDLFRSASELLAGLDDATRRSLHKAERSGLTIDRGDSVAALRAFYQLHCSTRRRHGVPPQPWRFFENIQRHVLATGKGNIFTVTGQGRPLAAAVFFHHGRTALYKFGASDPVAQQFRPNNLLLWEAIQWYASQRFTTLDFGRTSRANEGLRRFKLGFGPRESVLDYCRFDFRANAFVTSTDRADGWPNAIFRRLPLPLLRWAGATLYPHLS